MAAASLWCVLQLLLFSWPARTVGWPTVLLAFGVGAYGCGVFSVLIEAVVTRQLAAADETSMRTVMDTAMWTTAPAAEELLKILPLALAAWALRGRVQWGLTDFVVLGAAVGVGFGLLESVLQFAFAPDVHVRPVEAAGGWSVATRLFTAPFVSGFPELLGHWFPAAVGTLELGSATATVPVDNHVAWSALGGLSVGLVVCGHRWWVRAAGLLPLLAAVGLHTAVNYIAALPNAHGTPRAWYDRIVASGLWIVLGCLVAAVVWDLRTRRAGRAREAGVRLRGEREGADPGSGSGGGSVAALLNYALLRAPWTTLIALRYARRRRALFHVTTHPRARPEHIAALRDELTARTAELDATSAPEAWRGTSVREARRRLRARGAGRLPWWEKTVLVLGLLLLIPSGLLAATFAFEGTEELEEYFTEGGGWQLLIGCGLAGLLLAAFRLVMTWRSLRLVRTLPSAEPHAAALLRLGLVAGSLCAGALLLWRAGTIAENGKVLPDHLIVSFVLEKFLDVAPALILTLLMFALPFALPFGVATGGLGFLLPELLAMAAGRALAPVAARAAAQVGARLVARGLIAPARTDRFDLFPDAGNIRWGDDIVRKTVRGAEYKIPRTDGLHQLINPGRGLANCRACALATESTLRGYPASAIPRIPAGPISSLEKYFPGRSFRPSTLSNIVDDMKKSGDGARGIVFGGNRRGEVGHVFNVINRKGDIIFLDGQTGKASHVARWGNFQIMRTD